MIVQLSPNFFLQEFDCHSGEDVPPEVVPNIQKLVTEVLQPIRTVWGGLVVVSGWRSKAWNDRIGGAKKSTHMTGEGADIKPINPTNLPALIARIEEMYATNKLPGLGGFGKYKNWLHLDVKKAPDGHLRRWVGKGFGSER